MNMIYSYQSQTWLVMIIKGVEFSRDPTDIRHD